VEGYCAKAAAVDVEMHIEEVNMMMQMQEKLSGLTRTADFRIATKQKEQQSTKSAKSWFDTQDIRSYKNFQFVKYVYNLPNQNISAETSLDPITQSWVTRHRSFCGACSSLKKKHQCAETIGCMSDGEHCRDCIELSQDECKSSKKQCTWIGTVEFQSDSGSGGGSGGGSGQADGKVKSTVLLERGDENPTGVCVPGCSTKTKDFCDGDCVWHAIGQSDGLCITRGKKANKKLEKACEDLAPRLGNQNSAPTDDLSGVKPGECCSVPSGAVVFKKPY
jgi:hypothetical protein